jgi:uncharacterized repeat protein (TIGR03803 family)
MTTFKVFQAAICTSRIYAALVFGVLVTISGHAQTFNSLFSFDGGTNGADPYLMSLVQGFDGNFYGTASGGGPEGDGSVFRITPKGKLTTLYFFCSQNGCTDGAKPVGGLVETTNGTFYGTTDNGGANSSSCSAGCGTVFEITRSGKRTTIYNFCSQTDCLDGANPIATLIRATDGLLYGTTFGGGANGKGTVFKITAKGKLTTLYSFCSKGDCSDGAMPFAGLVQATNGRFYGTTQHGGINNNHCVGGCGTVFEITAKGTLTTMYRFCSQGNCPDGSLPSSALLQPTNGDFYGTTFLGGVNNGTCAGNCGTVFKMTGKGKLTTLHSFCTQMNCPDGALPVAGLVQGTDGNLYGTTYGDVQVADNNYYRSTSGLVGTVFRITLAGKLTTLHDFDSTDGANPTGGLLQATNGTFYGTTFDGGNGNGCAGNGCGTVFSESVGLGPFVQTLPIAGRVGAKVIILGNNLTGSTNVTFNGLSAEFTVVSATEITTNVPTGATTGIVQVTTPKGALNSNVAFRVIQ